MSPSPAPSFPFLPTTAPATSPDDDLIALSRAMLQRAVRLHRCDAGQQWMSDEEYERDQDELHEGTRDVMQLHPVTLEGLAAKAQLVRVQFERLVACDYAGEPGRCGETHERLAWSVLNDILEMTGTLEQMPTFSRGIAVS